MKRLIYNKLVRDKIPQIIEQSGKVPVIEILTDASFFDMLNNKLSEELAEYKQNFDIQELVDLLEVIYAIANTKGVSPYRLEELRLEKAKLRGGFANKILLKEVIEE